MSTHYEFFSQAKIISGAKALEHIPVELGSFDAVKPLVITENDAYKKGWAGTFIKAMYDSKVVIGALYDAVPAYSGLGQAQDLAVLFRDRGCDSIVAMGSGAVADVAKIVNVMVSEKTSDPIPYTEGKPFSSHLKPFVFAAAGPSKGNETTNRAVVDNHVIKSSLMYPDLIILDPRLTKGCCTECVVSSGMKALAQSAETFASAADNPMNDSYAGCAIQFITENLPAVAKKPGKKKEALALANASAMSGIAYSNAAPGMTTCLASAIARETGLDAGILSGVILPFAMEYRLQKKMPIRGDLLMWLAGMEIYSATPEKDRIAAAVRWIRNFKEGFGDILPPSLAAMRVPLYRLETTIEAAVAMGAPGFKEADYTNLLQRAYEGTVSQ